MNLMEITKGYEPKQNEQPEQTKNLPDTTDRWKQLAKEQAETLEKVTAERDELQARNQKMNEFIQEFQERTHKLKMDKQKLFFENHEMQEEMQKSNAEIQQMTAELSEMRKLNQSLQQSNDDLRNRNGLMSRSEQELLEEEIKDVRDWNSKLQVQVNKSSVEAVDQAQQEIERLDALLSTGEETSEVAQINANGGGTLSEDTTYLLERSLDLYDSTNGVFDIAIYPIMDAWGFTTGNYTIPSDETIESLLPLTDANDILYDKDSASISFAKDGMKIDFGGIAKGYTSGRIADIYRECGVTSGLINLGGNVQVVGTKTDGSKWRVAVQSPEAEDDYLGILSTADRAVITSGGYERYFEQDGMKYHHIIDPSTGHPANNGLVSVTIVSADGTLADGLSTSLFIMGKDKAAEYWRAHSDEFDTILEDEDGVLYVTEGIADDFASDHETNIIRKDGDT